MHIGCHSLGGAVGYLFDTLKEAFRCIDVTGLTQNGINQVVLTIVVSGFGAQARNHGQVVVPWRS